MFNIKKKKSRNQIYYPPRLCCAAVNPPYRYDGDKDIGSQNFTEVLKHVKGLKIGHGRGRDKDDMSRASFFFEINSKLKIIFFHRPFLYPQVRRARGSQGPAQLRDETICIDRPLLAFVVLAVRMTFTSPFIFFLVKPQKKKNRSSAHSRTGTSKRLRRHTTAPSYV